MSTPTDKNTIAELAKKLGIAIEKRDETIGSLKDAIKKIGQSVAGVPLARYTGLQQSSLADHVTRAETNKAHAKIAELHDRLERDFGKGARLALMTHDELIVEAPAFTIVELGGDIIEDRLEGLMTNGTMIGMKADPALASTWAEASATPEQILEDINQIAEQMRAAVPPVPAANYAGVSMPGAIVSPIVPMEFEQLPPQNSDLMIATAMHARVGGVVSYSPGSLAYMSEAIGYPHGDQTDHADANRYARDYAMGHWHRRTPPMATINCRCYADYRVIVAQADDDTGHYEAGEEITRAPWRMPKLRIAGRPIDQRALGWLAVIHDTTPREHQNRHTGRRWLRRFRPLLAVASDALAEGNRPLAISVLAEMIGVQEAIDLTMPVTTIRSHWTGTLTSKPVEHVAPFEQLIGRLKTNYPQIAEWEQALAEHPPIMRAGVIAVPLAPHQGPPPPGAAVYVDANGGYRFSAAPKPAAPIGTFIGPGDTPGTMLMRFGAVPEPETIELTGITGVCAGDGPFRFSNAGGKLPAGINPDQDYYAVDVETHYIKPGMMSPWPATVGEYAADDAALTLELVRSTAAGIAAHGQAFAPSTGAVLTPDGWRVTCGVCTRQVAEEDMASRELYPIGVCMDCYRRDHEGVE